MTHENFLAKRTTGLETSQVDSIFYGTGVYNSYHHNSAIADLRQRDWSPELFKTGDNGETRDSLQTVLDWCKTNNREFMWSMRMNDTHDKDYEVKYLDSFKQAHPDWLVSSRETCAVDLQLGALWSALDYAQQGVRQRSYDLLREVIMNYDVDGIELDFSRHSVYFAQVVRNAEDATPENIERMNNFMRSLRTLTEQVSAEKGEPILIAIHVADSMDYCKAIGLDVEQWMEEDLVDVVSIRTYGAYQSMEDGLAEYEAYDVPVYLIMDANNRGTDDYDYSKEAAMAYKAGYTGIQVYNVFNPQSELYWTLGDASTVTYDENYTEQSRVSTDSAYAIDAVARFVTYGKEKQSISFAESSVSKVYGDEDFTVTVSGVVEGSTVTYSSSNTKVAIVDATTGKVTICGAGEAVITATASGTKTHAGATATYTLTVTEAEASPSPTPEASPNPTPEASPNPTPEASPSPTPEVTPSPTPEVTPSPSPSVTPLEILSDGTDASYRQESGDETTIHCNGELSEFEGLKMDGTKVDSTNYDAKDGSTIISLKHAYLNSLSAGEHTVTLEYSGNRSIDAKLIILAADTTNQEDEEASDSVDDGASETTESVSEAPTAGSATPTGDNSNIVLWVMVFVMAAAACGTLMVFDRKRK